MIVEPNAGDRVEDNLNPVGRAYYGFSTLLCTPASLSQDVGLALGAQAGEARIRQVVEAGGFTRFRRVAETPFNIVYEAASVSNTSLAVRARRRPGPHGPSRPGPGTPMTKGEFERDGVRIHYEVYGSGETTVLLAADLVDRPLQALEDADSLPVQARQGGHVRRARQRPLRSAAYRIRGGRFRSRCPGRARRHRHRASGARVALAGRPARAAARRRASRAGRWGGFHRSERALHRHGRRSARRLERPAGHRRGLGQVQPALLAT